MAGKRKFRFSPHLTVFSVSAAILCYSMAVWQYNRYEYKKAYFTVLGHQEKSGLQSLDNQDADWPVLHYARVTVQGQFDFEREMVLINRSKEQTPGVKVITPFKIEGWEQRILVDRGFFPYAAYRQGELANARPQGLQQVNGIVRPSQTAQFFLAPKMSAPKPGTWKERWLRLEISVMAQQLPYPCLPVFLEQTNQEEGFPVYDPHEVLSAGRHLNYTIQWASFGSFALFFGFYLQFRKPRRHSEPEKRVGSRPELP